MVIHDYMAVAGMPNYTLTKNASTFAIQQIAKDLDDTQVISFHPGAIFTAAAKRAFGFGRSKEEVGIPFDDGEYRPLSLSRTLTCCRGSTRCFQCMGCFR